jgi:uncharacterized protein YlxP (DUF503 family)
MVIGVGRVVLHMPANLSLKDKRSIMKSTLAQIQHRFSVSAAEIERQDQWQIGVIGFACVSSEASHADSVLGSVIRYLQASHLDAELVDVQTELIHAL